MTETILDTGPLVAFLDGDDQHHGWAVEQFRRLAPKFVTCEAVITEACFLLHSSAIALNAVAKLIRDGHIEVPFHFSHEADAVMRLMDRYRDVPMSFTDACLVRMAEIDSKSQVLTLDRDFQIYRKNGRQIIPAILPNGD